MGPGARLCRDGCQSVEPQAGLGRSARKSPMTFSKSMRLPSVAMGPAVRPPSTAMVWPVTKVEASLARNSAVSAIRSEEHTSELQSLMRISYAVFCLKKKKRRKIQKKRITEKYKQII